MYRCCRRPGVNRCGAIERFVLCIFVTVGLGTEAINVPPGLEELNAITQILIKQRISIAEIAFNYEAKNKYIVMDDNEHVLYDALEDTTLRNRMFCPANRPFVMPVFDQNRVKVLVLSRPWRCCCVSCKWSFCLQILTVALPTGAVIGYVQQRCQFIKPRFEIQNASRDPYLKIWGPYCLSRCAGDVNFKVFNMQNEEVAIISKKWGGIAREYGTDADYFSVSYSENMNIVTKATLLGAAILIDFLYFERSKQPLANSPF